MRMGRFFCLVLLMTAAACAWVPGQAATQPGDPGVAQLGPGFSSGTADVNGTALHYVRGGSGPAIVLLHGFPQSWYEFRKVMPKLAAGFTVVAVDLRGVGDSAPAATGYDAANLARDVHELVGKLGLQQPYIFGHDIGGMVAYAYARRFPEAARGVMILDAAFPGLDPWDELVGGPAYWHVRFHQTDLPERLVTGRQAAYFRYFLGPGTFSDADVAQFAAAYRDPDHLSAAFDTYRAFPANAEFFGGESHEIAVPLVIGSGERDAFAQYVPRIAAAMRAHGCANLQIEMVPNSAHYVADEQPDYLAGLIERYASRPRPL